LEWKDLILNEETTSQIQEIETWLKHNNKLLTQLGMKNRIKPGFRVLFSGPPGTGKTLTASLLGKYTNRDVYRIDLSLVISKYIGETEKIFRDYLTAPKIKTGSCFSTKLMPCLANEPV